MPLKTDPRYVNMDLTEDPEPNHQMAHDIFWVSRQARTSDGSIDPEVTINKQCDALDALETAAEVHPSGPTILILRSKQVSYRRIAEKVGLCHQTVENIHKRVVQAVVGKLVP